LPIFSRKKKKTQLMVIGRDVESVTGWGIESLNKEEGNEREEIKEKKPGKGKGGNDGPQRHEVYRATKKKMGQNSIVILDRVEKKGR